MLNYCWPYNCWASLIVQLVKNLPVMQETLVWFLGWENPLPTPVFLDFPCGIAGKESACNSGDMGLIPGLGRSPEERKGYPLQLSGLENSMDCIVHGGTKNRTRLSSFHFIIVTTGQQFISSCLFLQRQRQLISTLPLRNNHQHVGTKLSVSFLFSAHTGHSPVCGPNSTTIHHNENLKEAHISIW